MMTKFQCSNDPACKGKMVPYDGPNPDKFNSAVCSVHNSRVYALPEPEKAEATAEAPTGAESVPEDGEKASTGKAAKA